MSVNIHYIKTADDLRLQGVEYAPKVKDVCVLFIHGMSGNFIENYFAHVLGEKLESEGMGFIYAHNRGYNHINDIATSEPNPDGGYKSVRVGAVYEIFTDCLMDIDAWMKECGRLGYKKIILLGHSLGAPKVIYYLNTNKPKNTVGVILASPGDMVGLIKKPEYQPNSDELYKEARKNVEDGKPRELLSSQIWNWYTLSSQTFLSLFEEKGPIDNLPLYRKDDKFEQLASIKSPILCVVAEHDDIAINGLNEDMDIIESKAVGAKSFTKKIVPHANHVYEGGEEEFAKIVCDWVEGLI